jgi:hypothetical protein
MDPHWLCDRESAPVSNRFVAAVSRILKKMDVVKAKPKHGPIPSYINHRQLLGEDEWDYLTAPEREQRKYNSSLSTPGRICHVEWCRSFVAGPVDRPCPYCGGKQ